MNEKAEDTCDRHLKVYLLGTLEFSHFLQLQRRIAYEISGESQPFAAILCDHPTLISIGREGSRNDLRLPLEELSLRNWPIQWVARGAGTLLHLPGQTTIYPILSLESLRITPAGYAGALNSIARDLVQSFGITPDLCDRPGAWVRDRQIVHVGAAIHAGMTGFGITVNVCPDLELFRGIGVDGATLPMTSLQRETPLRARIPTVRQRLLQLTASRFGCQPVLFHTHPALDNPQHADAPRYIRA